MFLYSVPQCSAQPTTVPQSNSRLYGVSSSHYGESAYRKCNDGYSLLQDDDVLHSADDMISVVCERNETTKAMYWDNLETPFCIRKFAKDICYEMS